MNDISAHQPPEPSSGGSGGPARRRWILASVAAGALALVGTVAALLLTDENDEYTYGRVKETGPGIGRAEGVTPAWMSGRMGLDIPATAESAQAAYEGTARFDTGLLTFTLTHAEAEAYLSEHPPQGKWLEPTEAWTGAPADDFTHLGLPEPETFRKDIRYGNVCPGTLRRPGRTVRLRHVRRPVRAPVRPRVHTATHSHLPQDPFRTGHRPAPGAPHRARRLRDLTAPPFAGQPEPPRAARPSTGPEPHRTGTTRPTTHWSTDATAPPRPPRPAPCIRPPPPEDATDVPRPRPASKASCTAAYPHRRDTRKSPPPGWTETGTTSSESTSKGPTASGGALRRIAR